jgi:hypothetical protein
MRIGWDRRLKCGAHASLRLSVSFAEMYDAIYCAAKEVPPLRMNMHVVHLLGKLHVVGHVSIFRNSHEFPCTNLTLS